MKFYEANGATIYHGEALTILGGLPDRVAAAVITDPPYSSGGMFRSDRLTEPSQKYRGWSHTPSSTHKPAAAYGSFAGDHRDQRGYREWMALWMYQCSRVAVEGASAYIFTDWRQLPVMTDALQAGGWTWRGVLVWDKGVGRPVKGRFRNHLEFIVWGTNGPAPESENYPSALISVPTVPPGERQHVTQKPAKLIRHLLSIVPQRGMVLDPFMGSGTTLRAASDLGWQSVGIELDERYCQMAVERLGQMTLEVPA